MLGIASRLCRDHLLSALPCGLLAHKGGCTSPLGAGPGEGKLRLPGQSSLLQTHRLFRQMLLGREARVTGGSANTGICEPIWTMHRPFYSPRGGVWEKKGAHARGSLVRLKVCRMDFGHRGVMRTQPRGRDPNRQKRET